MADLPCRHDGVPGERRTRSDEAPVPPMGAGASFRLAGRSAGGAMKTSDLVVGLNTVWVVIAAVLVMFMQAGFAFLEAGMTRMKNAAHVAGKNVLTFAVCSLVYWAVGYGIAFGKGNAIVGTDGFVPSVDQMLAVGRAPFSFITTVPAGAGYLF